MKLLRNSLTVAMCVLLFVLFTGCEKGETQTSVVPDNYKNVVIINYFTDTWSQDEMGADLEGNIQLVKGSDDYNVIINLLGDIQTKPADNSGNFMPDFSLSTGDLESNTFDFKFFDNQLIVRNLTGECFEVVLSETAIGKLKDYIEEIRLSIIEQGDQDADQTEQEEVDADGYTEDRPLTDDDTALFNTVMKEQAPENIYDLITVATHAEESTNHRFLVKVTTPADSHNAYIYIKAPQPDSDEIPVFVSEEEI